MFELIKNITFIIAGFFAFSWLIYFRSSWQELVQKYRTEHNLPRTFLTVRERRISFYRENESGVMTLTGLGIGISDYGLYLSSSIPLFFSKLLIPWSDIAYRKVAINNSSDGSYEDYTFYLGNPRVIRFSINADTINRLEQNYGEPIFVNKLGDPEQD